MRVCKLLASHPVYDMRTYHKEALSLKQAGHSVTLIVSGGTGIKTTDDGITIRYFTGERRTLTGVTAVIRRLISLVSLYRLAVRTPADVYHCHEPDSWLVGILCKLRTGRKVIFDAHEHFPSVVAEKFPRPFRPPIEGLGVTVMRLMARLTDHLVLTGEEFQEAIFKGIPTRMTVVLNGSTYNRVNADNHRSELRAQFGYTDDDFVLIFVGRMKESESASNILRALARCVKVNPRVKCIFVGGFFEHGKSSDALNQRYERLIQQLGLENHVNVTSWLPFERVESYLIMGDAGLFLRTSMQKNAHFGPAHKMFDYMAMGLPIIGSSAIEYSHIIEDCNCGLLVDPDDPEEISMGILNLVNNSDAATQIGNNGFEAHKRLYSWDIQAQRLLSAYVELKNEK